MFIERSSRKIWAYTAKQCWTTDTTERVYCFSRIYKFADQNLFSTGNGHCGVFHWKIVRLGNLQAWMFQATVVLFSRFGCDQVKHTWYSNLKRKDLSLFSGGCTCINWGCMCIFGGDVRLAVAMFYWVIFPCLWTLLSTTCILSCFYTSKLSSNPRTYPRAFKLEVCDTAEVITWISNTSNLLKWHPGDLTSFLWIR